MRGILLKAFQMLPGEFYGRAVRAQPCLKTQDRVEWWQPQEAHISDFALLFDFFFVDRITTEFTGTLWKY